MNKPKNMIVAEEFFLAKLEKALTPNNKKLTEEDRRILVDTDIFGFSDIMPDLIQREIWMDRMINALTNLWDSETANHIAKAKQLNEEGNLKGYDLLLPPREWMSMNEQLGDSSMIVLQCVVGGWLNMLSKRQVHQADFPDGIVGY